MFVEFVIATPYTYLFVVVQLPLFGLRLLEATLKGCSPEQGALLLECLNLSLSQLLTQLSFCLLSSQQALLKAPHLMLRL